MKKYIILLVFVTTLIFSACSKSETAVTGTTSAREEETSASITVDNDLVPIGSKGIKTKYYNALFEIEYGTLLVTLNGHEKRYKTQIDGCTELQFGPMTAEDYTIYGSLSLYDADGLKDMKYLAGKDHYFTREEIETALGPLTEVD